MEIINWGSRGSIPVSGQDFLEYGGDTTCVEIISKNNYRIIIDAGSGIRNLGTKILKNEINEVSIIFTHSHLDHLLGFPFFKPIYMKGKKIDIYGCPFAQEAIRKIFSSSMIPPFFPVDYEDLSAEITFHGAALKPFTIDTVEIIPIALSHPNHAIGYKFIEDGKSFVFLTDNELTFQHAGGFEYKDYVEFSLNADLLFHDAEFTEKEYKKTKSWGHSTYKKALQLALDANVKQFGLFHHNQERTDLQIDKIVEDCKRVIEQNNSELICFGVKTGTKIKL